jgi:hypothetical protein
MMIDNIAALQLLQDPISVDRTKHIDFMYCHVREDVHLDLLTFTHDGNIPQAFWASRSLELGLPGTERSNSTMTLNTTFFSDLHSKERTYSQARKISR